MTEVVWCSTSESCRVRTNGEELEKTLELTILEDGETEVEVSCRLRGKRMMGGLNDLERRRDRSVCQNGNACAG